MRATWTPALLVLLPALLADFACLTWTPPGTDDDSAADDDTADDDDAADDDDTGDDDDDTGLVDGDGDGYLIGDGDCDDDDPSRYPGAPEDCDGLDDDCDGTVDEDLPQQTWYRDSDGDGYGSPHAADQIQACAAPPGWDDDALDCADNLAAVNPAATETCNGLDDNCDGAVDEGVQESLWQDWDGDGWGGTEAGSGCAGPGYATRGGDCDDISAGISPDDHDGDGWSGCAGDCDDANSGVYPGVDADGDGYGPCDGDCDDNDPSLSPGVDNDGDGWSVCSGDCADTDFTRNPGVYDGCNGIDDDCDGQIDDAALPIRIVHGGFPTPGQNVAQTLAAQGWCTVPYDVTTLDAAPPDLRGAALIVITHDSGSTAGWFAGTQPVLDAYFWGIPLLGMGTGGWALFTDLGLGLPFVFGADQAGTGGLAYAVDPGQAVWTSPNLLLPSGSPSGSTVTVYSQASPGARFADGASLGSSVVALAGADAAFSDYSLAHSGWWPDVWLWSWDLGLQLATADGHDLFVNVVQAAAGAPPP